MRGNWPDWSSENELFQGVLDRIAPWLEKALDRMPIFTRAGIKRIINGAIPHTPDGNPLVGPIPGVPNAWDFCGSSITIAQGAGCGKFLAQWIIHGDAEINMASVDLAPVQIRITPAPKALTITTTCLRPPCRGVRFRRVAPAA